MRAGMDDGARALARSAFDRVKTGLHRHPRLRRFAQRPAQSARARRLSMAPASRLGDCPPPVRRRRKPGVAWTRVAGLDALLALVTSLPRGRHSDHLGHLSGRSVGHPERTRSADETQQSALASPGDNHLAGRRHPDRGRAAHPALVGPLEKR